MDPASLELPDNKVFSKGWKGLYCFSQKSELKLKDKAQSLRCEPGEFAILTRINLFINKIVTG